MEKITFEYEYVEKQEDVREHIRNCEGRHTQQAIISQAIAEDRKELREKVEGMKTYTGGSSVNEKDKRVNKQEVLSLLEEK